MPSNSIGYFQSMRNGQNRRIQATSSRKCFRRRNLKRIKLRIYSWMTCNKQFNSSLAQSSSIKKSVLRFRAVNPSPPFKPKEHKPHKQLRFSEPSYDYDYSSERDLDSSLPYGIQTVIADPSRIPRAKTRITRVGRFRRHFIQWIHVQCMSVLFSD